MLTIANDVKLKILILSKHLSLEGGIVNFTMMLMENFSKKIQGEHFTTGDRNRMTGKLHGSYLAFRDSLHLIKKLRRERYDCIHINTSLNVRSLLRDGLFLLITTTLGYKNIIVFFHGWDKKIEAQLRNNVIFRFLFRQALTSVAKILVLGSQFRSSLIEVGIPTEKIKYITTFFNGDIFNGVKKRTPSKEKRLLFLSRFIIEKGVFETLEAFNLLAPEFPELMLVLAGDGPEMHSLKKRVKEYGIEERVVFLGYVRGSSKAQVLIDSDIFILPTHGEGCPVALLEAMAAGLPVITCPVGGIPDIFINEKNGVLLPEVSSTLIAEAIRRLIHDPSLSSKISENNRRYAWENLERRIVTEKVEQLYAEVARQHI